MRFTVVAALALVGAASALADDEIQWAKDWDSARLQSQASGKLIMLDFYADW